MNIDSATIAKVADLARIEISAAEAVSLQADMTKILTFMEKLNELDTAGVAPLVYMNEEPQVWRADTVIQELTPAEALNNAALHTDSFFMVPKILDK